MATWDREIDLDLDGFHRVVAAQFPEFTNLQPIEFGSGWDNICLLYPNNIVFRMPTRAMGGNLMEIECRALPLIQDRLSLPIPTIRHFGEPSEAFPYRFMGYERLAGTTADRLAQTAEDRKQAASKIGAFLRELHAMPISDELSGVVPRGAFSLDWVVERIQFRCQHLLEIDRSRKDWSDMLMRRANYLADLADDSARPTLCHGDLYPRHVLVDPEGVVSGIIDWGDIQIANAATDLSIAFTFFDYQERLVFWSAYGGEPDQPTLALVQLKAILYAFALVGYGLDIQDRPIYELGNAIGERVNVWEIQP